MLSKKCKIPKFQNKFFLFQISLLRNVKLNKVKLYQMMNAVEIKSACKYYGSKKDPQLVLNGLDMTVKKNTM